MKTDTLFYRLFQDRPALLFELTGLAWRDAAGYVWRAVAVVAVVGNLRRSGS
jgi:predicted transposase YdaD